MLIASALAFVFAAGVQTGSTAVVPTAIENGLLDRACKDSAQQPDVHEKCRDEKLTAMRADFGKDLAKVKAEDRKTVDDACNPLLADAALKGREPYVDCMVDHLVALSKSMKRGRAFAQAMASSAAAAAETPAADAAPPPPARAAGIPMPMMIGGVVAGVFVLGGIAFVVMRAKKAPVRKCRQCGADSPDSDLCANCRRAAAEALRRSKTERADQLRQEAEEAKREELRQQQKAHLQKQREAEERRVREYDEARERAHAERIAEASRPNTPEPESAPSPYDAEAFDPYVILGVAPDATVDAIKKAYETAKKKYDPDLVGHLSEEVQAHYREKAQAVDRAYAVIGGGSLPA